MFAEKPPQEPTELDRTITAAHAALTNYPTYSKEFADTVDQLVKLHLVRDTNKPSNRVSPDTLAIVLGNLLIAWRITKYEREDVITTKLGGFLMKLIH